MKTSNTLTQENHQYAGTGGISKNNRHLGFVPAFMDANTGNIYRSKLPDGRPAPVHMLCGLPQEILNTVISGFLLKETFYTREQATVALRNMQ